MSKTRIVCPNCGAEFAIPETSYMATGMVIGADSDLGTIHPAVVGQCTDYDCTNRKPSNPKPHKNMKAEAKLEALRKAGVNVDNLFSMKGVNGEETIARLENGNLTIVPDDDPVFAAIIDNGTIPNSKLFRRWVMAQVFHMLATGNFTKALQWKGYCYQWKMLVDEMAAQAKMWSHGDNENYLQRNIYFDKDRVVAIVGDYIAKLEDHLRTLPRKKCKGVPYVRLKGKNIFAADLQSKVINPLKSAQCAITASRTPVELSLCLNAFYKFIQKTWLDRGTAMAAAFKDSYKGAGAYFTMRNMILFHNVKFRDGMGRFLSQEKSLQMLEIKARDYRYEGWRLFGLMKQLIEDNGINIMKKMAEWHKKSKRK